MTASAKGQRIGYVCVSSLDQNTDRQLDGIELDRIFTDKASGKSTARPALAELLRYAREGDTIYVHSIDRLAHNLDDLRHLVDDLTTRGIRLQFFKENLVFSGHDNPTFKLMLSVMGAISEFERALIRERQREGIAIAKKRGKYKGRKQVLTVEEVSSARERAEAGERKAVIAREMNISRNTLYRYLNHAAIPQG